MIRMGRRVAVQSRFRPRQAHCGRHRTGVAQRPGGCAIVHAVALQPIDPLALRVDRDGPTLLGGWSPTSGLRHFPPAPVCPFTGADDVEPVDLEREGTVWLHTMVNVAPPGYTGRVPYGFGIVELAGTPLLRIVTRLDGEGLGRGDRVRLAAEEVPGPDGEPVLTWVFRA
jgi:uncharacterized OB-fold protein